MQLCSDENWKCGVTIGFQTIIAFIYALLLYKASIKRLQREEKRSKMIKHNLLLLTLVLILQLGGFIALLIVDLSIDGVLISFVTILQNILLIRWNIIEFKKFYILQPFCTTMLLVTIIGLFISQLFTEKQKITLAIHITINIFCFLTFITATKLQMYDHTYIIPYIFTFKDFQFKKVREIEQNLLFETLPPQEEPEKDRFRSVQGSQILTSKINRHFFQFDPQLSTTQSQIIFVPSQIRVVQKFQSNQDIFFEIHYPNKEGKLIITRRSLQELNTLLKRNNLPEKTKNITESELTSLMRNLIGECENDEELSKFLTPHIVLSCYQ